MNKNFAKYGVSDDANFYVIDMFGVPHPYCIGPKHVAFASDYRCGNLDEEAIESAEKEGAYCCTCKGKLSYKEHEFALLVECNGELRDADGVPNQELQNYLYKIKDEVEKDGYVGFAFTAKRVSR